MTLILGVALRKASARGRVVLLKGWRYMAAQSSALMRKVVLPVQHSADGLVLSAGSRGGQHWMQ